LVVALLPTESQGQEEVRSIDTPFMKFGIEGKPAGGTLSVFWRCKPDTAKVTIVTTDLDTPESVAEKLMAEVERLTVQDALGNWRKPIPATGRSGDKLLLRGTLPADYYFVTTDKGIKTLPMPTELRASLSGSTISLSWRAVEGADGYYLARNDLVRAAIRGGNVVSYDDQHLSASALGLFDSRLEQHSYTVSAFRGNVVSPPSAIVKADNPSRLIVPQQVIPNAAVGVFYSHVLTVNNPVNTATWTLTSGGLPPNMTLSAQGQVSGVPTVSGSFAFSVMVTDAIRREASANMVITVIP
jgi:hypothetical protein